MNRIECTQKLIEADVNQLEVFNVCQSITPDSEVALVIFLTLVIGIWVGIIIGINF